MTRRNERALIAFAFVSAILVSGCGGPAEQRQSNLTCINRSIIECMQSLENGIFLNETELRYYENHFKERDINGKPIAKPSMHLSGKLRYNPDDDDLDRVNRALKYGAYVHVTIDWDPTSKIINAVFVTLPGNPYFARTPSEYKRSGLWDIVKIVACPRANKAEVWQLYETSKTGLQNSGRTERQINWNSASEASTRRVQGIPFCGHRVGFGSLTGNSTDSITVNNPTGAHSEGNLWVKP